MTRLWNGWLRNQVLNPGWHKGVSSRACRLALWTNEHPNQWVLKRSSPRSKADRTWNWLLTSLPCGGKKCARYASNPPYTPSRSDINRPLQTLRHTGSPKTYREHQNIQGAPKHTGSPKTYTTLQFVVGFFSDWILLFRQEAVFWIPVMIFEKLQQHTDCGLGSTWYKS
jgi:hypothetical protein